MVDSGVIMINIHDSYQGGVCVGVVPLLTVEMQKQAFLCRSCDLGQTKQ